MSINPLSNPKGVKYLCEMCGRTALLKCEKCNVTFYCSKEHKNIDAKGIHDKICMLLGPLRTPPAVIGSEEERARRRYTLDMSRRALIDLTKNESSKFLVKGNYELAIPGALQALRFSVEVFGEGNIGLVPPYLLLAEAHLGLGKFQQAEEFLSLANWSVLKHPDCSNLIKSQLYRNFGKLYTAQKKYENALTNLAEDIYYASLDMGPEHVLTAGGYYLMANIFLSQNKLEQALAFLDKVVDVWYKYLAGMRNKSDTAETLTEAQLAEALEMLKQILQTRVNYLGPNHIASGEAKYTLSLLYIFIGDTETAYQMIQEAHSVYTTQLGKEHPSTKDVEEVLNMLKEAILRAEQEKNNTTTYI